MLALMQGIHRFRAFFWGTQWAIPRLKRRKLISASLLLPQRDSAKRGLRGSNRKPDEGRQRGRRAVFVVLSAAAPRILQLRCTTADGRNISDATVFWHDGDWRSAPSP